MEAIIIGGCIGILIVEVFEFLDRIKQKKIRLKKEAIHKEKIKERNEYCLENGLVYDPVTMTFFDIKTGEYSDAR